MQGDFVEIQTAVISGLLALIGGFFGARFARDLEHEKWLRQERSTAFREFLTQLNDAWINSTEARWSESPPDADGKITEKFLRLEPAKNIVRLFLEESDREPFTQLVHQRWVAQTSSALDQSSRAEKTSRAMREIQLLFEKRLHG